MSGQLHPQQSIEVIQLQSLIESIRQNSPDIWQWIGLALNATDASVLTTIEKNESQAIRIESSTETTEAASRLENVHV